jgi:hypothetical protein
VISAAKVVIGAVTAVICGRARRDRRGWSPLAESTSKPFFSKKYTHFF